MRINLCRVGQRFMNPINQAACLPYQKPIYNSHGGCPGRCMTIKHAQKARSRRVVSGEIVR